MKRRTMIILLALSLVCLGAVPASAQQWGTLKGKFVFDGTPPTPGKLSIDRDVEVCGKHNLVDESLVVNPKNKGIANIVVSIYVARGDKQPPEHPDFAKWKTAKVVMDNDKCRFEPRVVAVRPSQTLVIGNKDTVGHNTKIDPFKNDGINPTIPAGSTLTHQFPLEEVSPAAVSCSIHPWMKAWLVIKDSPYVAVTDADGAFEIPNLPQGTWTFTFWQEKSGFIAKATVNGKKEDWGRRGRVDLQIGPGTMDLGTILVDPVNFEK